MDLISLLKMGRLVLRGNYSECIIEKVSGTAFLFGYWHAINIYNISILKSWN